MNVHLASVVKNVCKGTEVEAGKPWRDESTAMILIQVEDAGLGREMEVEVVRRSGFWRSGRWRQRIYYEIRNGIFMKEKGQG